jgi:hypothetical protein
VRKAPQVIVREQRALCAHLLIDAHRCHVEAIGVNVAHSLKVEAHAGRTRRTIKRYGIRPAAVLHQRIRQAEASARLYLAHVCVVANQRQYTSI